MLRFKSFVQAPAAWTARKQSVGPVIELKGADDAAQSVTQRSAFAPAAVPLANYPEEENCRKENKQVDGDKGGEANPDHGEGLSVVGFAGVLKSLPQSIVAVVQMRRFLASGFGFWIAGKRQRRR